MQPKQTILAAVEELTAIRYELSLYVDDGLLVLGENLEKAIEKLSQTLSASESEVLDSGAAVATECVADLTPADLPIDLPLAAMNSVQIEKAVSEAVSQVRAFQKISGAHASRLQSEPVDIIDLSSMNLKSLEEFFPSELATPKKRRKRRKRNLSFVPAPAKNTFSSLTKEHKV